MAEFLIDVDQSGEWFGGGHLMRQHWPLNLGCWEVGMRNRQLIGPDKG